MIYTAQLYAGDWYVMTETNAPKEAAEAIRKLPQAIFAWNQESEARAAVKIARMDATEKITAQKLLASSNG